MFEVGVVTQFEAAHRLVGDFGPATRLHGHTYRIEVSARGPSLQPDGTLYDLGHLQEVVAEVSAQLHFRTLEEVEGFEGRNTTAETVALYFYERVAPRLKGNSVGQLSIRVWESPGAWATYQGPPTAPETPPG